MSRFHICILISIKSTIQCGVSLKIRFQFELSTITELFDFYTTALINLKLLCLSPTVTYWLQEMSI